MQQMDDAEAARRAAAEEQARREQQILDAVDQVALAYSDVEKGDAELARLTGVWATFTDVSPESATKLENALGHAKAALDARRRELAVLRESDKSYYLREERLGWILGPYEAGAPACFVDGVPEWFGKSLLEGDDKTPAEDELHFENGLTDYLDYVLQGRKRLIP